MRFDIVTLFPEIFSGYLGQSLLKKAIDRGLVEVRVHALRDWAQGRHKQLDDRPYGGGPGMVLMAPPVVECVEALQDPQQLARLETEGSPASAPVADVPAGRVVLLTPRGRRLDQALVRELAEQRRLILLCGRYEGFDERVRMLLQPEEISIGDFILNGGEVAAMTLVDAVVRLVPGVLGDAESSEQDSFSTPERWLEFDQYTRPREYRGLKVPEILLSGDHAAIARWRKEESLARTRQRRSDLLPPASDESI